MVENTDKGTKMVVVDDEPNVLRMVSYALEVEGYVVVVATNGVEALNKVQTEAPDLIILDDMMPQMGGVEVCEHLRKQQETIDLPIIMLSAKTQVSDKVRGFEAGADEYITKPISREELIARVKALLMRYQHIRRSLPKKLGKVLAFIGAKGGVGTTTTALNVATAVSMQEKRVVAAEIRPSYGTFSAQLNLVRPVGLVSLLELDPGKIDERVVSSHLIALPSGLRLLVGPQSAAEHRDIEPQRVETIINIIASMVDYAILDLPSIPSDANQAALRRCDFVALVVEPESTTLASGIVAVEQMRLWGLHGDRVGVIIVNRTSLPAPIKPDQFRTGLEHEVIGVIPTGSEAIGAAQRAGLPVVLYRPDSDTSGAFVEIIKRI